MPIDLLTPADIPRSLELSTASGWNQIEADWQRLLDLFPQTCFAYRDETGHILGTATLASYDNAGWVGMVLVDSATRGQGIGGQLFEHACNAGRDLETIGLDATDLGRPVYEKRGFQVHSQINRWLIPCTASNSPVSSRSMGVSPMLHGRDAHATLIDRSALLNHLAKESNTITLATAHAHAIARPGRAAWHIGPVVATDPAGAQQLVEQLLQLIAQRGGAQVLLDLPAHTPLSAWLTSQGHAPARTLLRMFRPLPTKPYLTTPQIHAAASFELG